GNTRIRAHCLGEDAPRVAAARDRTTRRCPSRAIRGVAGGGGHVVGVALTLRWVLANVHGGGRELFAGVGQPGRASVGDPFRGGLVHTPTVRVFRAGRPQFRFI
ncbi:unnamed protein product, partial [Ixodes pacificus]